MFNVFTLNNNLKNGGCIICQDSTLTIKMANAAKLQPTYQFIIYTECNVYTSNIYTEHNVMYTHAFNITMCTYTLNV